MATFKLVDVARECKVTAKNARRIIRSHRNELPVRKAPWVFPMRAKRKVVALLTA